jgi:CHAT domain-containing protein
MSRAASLLLVLTTGAGRAWAQAGAPPAPERQQAVAACERAAGAYNVRQWAPALQAAVECARIARKIGAHDVVAWALLTRGEVAYRQGEFLDGMPLFRESLQEAERAGDRARMSFAYKRISDASSGLGDVLGMMHYARLAIDTHPHPTDRMRLQYQDTLGWSYMELRERDKAFGELEQGLALARRVGDDEMISTFHYDLGMASMRLDRDVNKALEYYAESLRLARRRKDTQAIVNVLNGAGNALRSARRWQEAERNYLEAVALTRQPFLLKNLGIVYRETGRAREAEAPLLEALEIADRQGAMRARWQARKELGTLLRDSDPERAARYYEECLELLEGRGNNVLLEGWSAGALAGELQIADDPYDLYVELLLKQGQAEKAFGVAERARARAFLDTLTGSREALAATVSSDYVRAEREALRAISERQAALRRGGLAAARENELTAEVRRQEERLTALRLQLSAAHPEVAHARYPRLPTASEVRDKVLAPDELLLEYFVGAERTTLWVVRRGGLEVVRLPGPKHLEPVVRAYLDALTIPESDPARAGRAVAEILLPPAAAITGAKRVLVVPHGILHYLPFETLPLGDGRLLVEAAAVAYAPSAASLAYLRSRPRPAPGGVVAIGNPVFAGAGAAEERLAALRSVGFLKPLPWSGREIGALAASYSGTRVLEQERATEPALRQSDLEHAAILHFATHGFVDEQTPERSGLALSVAPGSDGILQTREVYGLRLQASLVTLSACQTALGKQVAGEGVLGLSRAFFHAGARAVMASLWNVNDASTSEYMQRFYAALREGEAADAAARSAKLSFLTDARLRHPYFWGAFVVSGDAAASVRVRTPRYRYGPAVGLVLLAAMPVGLLLRRRGPAVR